MISIHCSETFRSPQTVEDLPVGLFAPTSESALGRQVDISMPRENMPQILNILRCLPLARPPAALTLPLSAPLSVSSGASIALAVTELVDPCPLGVLTHSWLTRCLHTLSQRALQAYGGVKTKLSVFLDPFARVRHSQ